jgi:glycerol-3-phosphate dehydrogenase
VQLHQESLVLKRDAAALTEGVFDVVVIGGGICGASVARDAALRGLRVAVIESGDWCHATSAYSMKIAHGGIRYLQHADLRRVRESCRERSAFLRTAPHLVHPLEFVIPAYGHGRAGKEILAVAFAVLHAATLDRNRGIDDPERRVRMGRTISREECLRWFPSVEPRGLTGAGVFEDGQIFNPPRLVLAVVRSAVEAGASALNYCEARGWLGSLERVEGVRARDKVSGEELEIRARVVVNAAGPFAEEILVRSGTQSRRTVPLSRDLAIVTPKQLVRGRALAVQTRYRDPDAVFTRGNRHLFVVPWREYTLIGVNSKVHDDEPSALTVPEVEVQGFLDEIREAHPPFALELEDVTTVMGGLLPFGLNEPGSVDLSFGKRSVLTDHARTQGREGLITAMSVRFTTGRSVAEGAVDLTFRKLGKEPPRCRTTEVPVYGGGFGRFAELIDDVTRAVGPRVGAGVPEHLARSHGSNWRDVVRLIDEDPSLARRLGDSRSIEAEVTYAARHEMAETLADVVLRRTDLGSGAFPGEEALHAAARRMGAERGWTRDHLEREMSAVRAAYPPWARAKPAPSAA